MTAPPDITVTDDPAGSRFVVAVDGRPAGFAAYRLLPGRVVFTHTQISDDFEGRGVGSALARQALDAVRDRGEKVVAQCPFIASWIQRHRDYADLVADGPGHAR